MQPDELLKDAIAARNQALRRYHAAVSSEEWDNAAVALTDAQAWATIVTSFGVAAG